MTHNHGIPSGDKKGLLISILLNSGIVIAEFIGGILSGSLALLSDAVHNLSDVIALILSYIGEVLSKKKGDMRHTFAFKRAEVIIAFVNSLVLLAVGIYIIYEAVMRFSTQQAEINSSLMLIIGAIGFLGNFVSIFFLHREKDDNLNKKSAYLHLLFDTVSSVIVVIGGIIIYHTNWYGIDLVASIIISLFVIRSGWGVLKSSLHILMQGVPEDINLATIIHEIEQIPGIENLHDIHIWSIDSNDVFLSAHLVVSEEIIKEDLIKTINELLEGKWMIHYTSLQIVSQKCC